MHTPDTVVKHSQSFMALPYFTSTERASNVPIAKLERQRQSFQKITQKCIILRWNDYTVFERVGPFS